eukprot:s2705_g1.t1
MREIEIANFSIRDNSDLVGPSLEVSQGDMEGIQDGLRGHLNFENAPVHLQRKVQHRVPVGGVRSIDQFSYVARRQRSLLRRQERQCGVEGHEESSADPLRARARANRGPFQTCSINPGKTRCGCSHRVASEGGFAKLTLGTKDMAKDTFTARKDKFDAGQVPPSGPCVAGNITMPATNSRTTCLGIAQSKEVDFGDPEASEPDAICERTSESLGTQLPDRILQPTKMPLSCRVGRGLSNTVPP